MHNSDATPLTSWPRHLQESWRDCVHRGEVDASNPPSSIEEAYLQVTEARARRWGIFWGDDSGHVDDPEAEEEHHFLGLRLKLATCSACGAGNLGHFYRSTVKGTALCPGCFQEGVGREVGETQRHSSEEIAPTLANLPSPHPCRSGHARQSTLQKKDSHFFLQMYTLCHRTGQ